MSSPSEAQDLSPAWTPSPEFIATTNIAWLMKRAGVDSCDALHAWSVQNREAYWAIAIGRLGIRFQTPYAQIMDPAQGIESPRWLPGAMLNIVESCFTAPANSPAIVYQKYTGALQIMTVGELEALTHRVARGLAQLGFKAGDAIAIFMPMTAESVAIYLGIIRAGCVVVGVADSFRPKEIAIRLHMAGAVAVFTQDVSLRVGKEAPLYGNIVEAEAPRAIVLAARESLSVELRSGDIAWSEFLGDAAPFEPVAREPSDPLNILFSSGTTGEPKAIPWTQTTPIKCAADAHFHQNIQPGDVLVWPTNIGWMMGPWLIFASLLNKAAMGLYYDAPVGPDFARFVQDSRATMLGVIPSLVKTWRATDSLRDTDWSGIKVFSSTGECSNAGDMRWLMAQAGDRPMIEYCGGTEVGGGYITGTVTRPCIPGTFNTAALGLDFVILDEEGHEAQNGEVFLVSPSIGFSGALINRDHHEVYYAGTPAGPHGETLRRHGDQIEKLPHGYWRAHGRADDTMNLGGIKISSAEIERALQSVPDVLETAAIAVSPSGPSQLVIYAVCSSGQALNKDALAAVMQTAIKRDLNPLFKIHDLVIVDSLPRTASNKVMRRVLRDQYLSTL